MTSSIFTIPTVITELPSTISAIVVDHGDQNDLQELLRHIRVAQRCLDALAIKTLSHSDALASKGESASGFDIALDQGQVSANVARLESKRAETVAVFPGLLEAASAGLTSGGHIDSISKHTSKLSEDEKQNLNYKEITDAATQLPADTFNSHIKRLVKKIKRDHGLADTVSKQKASEFKHWFNNDTGMGNFFGQLDPERYEALTNAVDRHTRSLANNTSDEATMKDSNLAASAIFELVTSSMKNKQNLPLINIVVDHETLKSGPHETSITQTGLGEELPPETVSRLCCDAVLQKVVLDEKDVPINVGRKYRTATDAQWAATKSVYKSCSWQNCERRLSWCQLHHIKEWEHGGPTNLNNLVPLCNHHHHQVHEGKWTIKLKPDRSLKIWKPNGTHWATTDPPTRKPEKFNKLLKRSVEPENIISNKNINLVPIETCDNYDALKDHYSTQDHTEKIHDRLEDIHDDKSVPA